MAIGSTPKLTIDGVGILATAQTVVSGDDLLIFSDVTTSATTALEETDEVGFQMRFMVGSDVATMVEGYAVIKDGFPLS